MKGKNQELPQNGSMFCMVLTCETERGHLRESGVSREEIVRNVIKGDREEIQSCAAIIFKNYIWNSSLFYRKKNILLCV